MNILFIIKWRFSCPLNGHMGLSSLRLCWPLSLNIIIFWTRNPISSKYMSFLVCVLGVKHHSNIGFLIRKVTKYGLSTLDIKQFSFIFRISTHLWAWLSQESVELLSTLHTSSTFTHLTIVSKVSHTSFKSPSGEGFIIYEHTSHPSNIKTWPPKGLLLVHLKWPRVDYSMIFKVDSSVKSTKNVTSMLHTISGFHVGWKRGALSLSLFKINPNKVKDL